VWCISLLNGQRRFLPKILSTVGTKVKSTSKSTSTLIAIAVIALKKLKDAAAKAEKPANTVRQLNITVFPAVL